MRSPAYEAVIDIFNVLGGAMPAMRCPEFYALLEELFTPEEAELVSRMPPLALISAEDLAGKIGEETPGTVKEMLETLADKGILFSTEREGVRSYTLMPLIPGIFEMQFMSGDTSERSQTLARLFEDYFEHATRSTLEKAQATPEGRVDLPFARVIAVEEDIPADVAVHPYDSLSSYINRTNDIAVSYCYCRHHGELLGNPCDKPKEVCMSFGPSARYVAERGFGRLVSREEAMRILDLSEQAGLVHCSSNTSKYINFICNCCDCHCGIIQSMKRGILPMGAASSLVVTLDEERCVSCGNCVERCVVNALVLENDSPVLRSHLCIGCGLCISFCPAEALKMAPREEASQPPRDQQELGAALMGSLQIIR